MVVGAEESKDRTSEPSQPSCGSRKEPEDVMLLVFCSPIDNVSQPADVFRVFWAVSVMLREPYGSRDKILTCVHCNCYAFSSKVTYILILDYATCEIMRYLVSFLIWIHVLIFIKLKGTFLLVLMTIIKEWEAPRTQKHNREKPDEWAFVLVDEIRKTSKETAQLCTAISFEYLPHLTLHSPDIKTGPSGFTLI